VLLTDTAVYSIVGSSTLADITEYVRKSRCLYLKLQALRATKPCPDVTIAGYTGTAITISIAKRYWYVNVCEPCDRVSGIHEGCSVVFTCYGAHTGHGIGVIRQQEPTTEVEPGDPIVRGGPSSPLGEVSQEIAKAALTGALGGLEGKGLITGSTPGSPDYQDSHLTAAVPTIDLPTWYRVIYSTDTSRLSYNPKGRDEVYTKGEMTSSGIYIGDEEEFTEWLKALVAAGYTVTLVQSKRTQGRKDEGSNFVQVEIMVQPTPAGQTPGVRSFTRVNGVYSFTSTPVANAVASSSSSASQSQHSYPTGGSPPDEDSGSQDRSSRISINR